MIDDLLGDFGSSEIKGGGEGIGFCGRGCDDGDGEGAWGGNSGSGVDDMAVGAAILFEALKGSAGGAEGLILQFDLDEGLIGVEWIMESDGPRLEEGSGLVAESVTSPLATATFMARDFSVEMVDTRSTACANSLHGTFRILSLPVGMTRS